MDKLYGHINIDHPSARIRAYKSLYWVPRLSSIGLSIFQELGELVLPYYSDEMCKFICTVPERHLEGRKIQIEYIKRKAPELAGIPWQVYDLDLYSYHYFNTLYFPRRVYRYVRRIIREKILKISPVIQRNWELQFLGKGNRRHLENWLFETPELYELVPRQIVDDFYHRFKKVNPVKYSHPVSMLLTLAIWCRRIWKNN